jgi:hypothetical protein
MAMANQPNTKSGRGTKAERREQARRERIELERKIARGRRNRVIAIGLAIAVAAGVGVYALTRPKASSADAQELLAGAAAAAQAAGCSEVQDVGTYLPEGQDQAHVASEEMPPLSNYASIPPASGPHNEVTLDEGFYDEAPDMGRLLHSLEHGAAIVWYAPDTPAARVDRLRDFYQGEAGDRVIVAPYDYPVEGEAGQLPEGTEMALVAWHHVETCDRADLGAAFDFTARYAAPPYGEEEYLGQAPEAGAGF